MKWHFFYDENESSKYHSFADWGHETRHIHCTLAIILILIVIGFLFFSIFPIS